MKTLILFLVVCLTLAALAVWQLVPGHRQRPTALPEYSRPGRTVEPQRSPTPTASLPTSAPAAGPATRPTSADRRARRVATEIRWAGDLRRRRAERRFRELRQIIRQEPNNEPAVRAALALARQLEWPNEECDLLGRLLRLRPNDVALRFEYATTLMRLRRWLEALEHLRLVVAGEPEHAAAWYNLAVAHQSLAHLHDARATWDRVIELMPDNPDAYFHRGEVLLDLEDFAAAADDFRNALRLDPGATDAALNLALALSRLGRLEEARQTLLPLLDGHPRHVPLLNRLAEIIWELYQADPRRRELARQTVDCCRRSLEQDPAQPELRALLEEARRAAD